MSLGEHNRTGKSNINDRDDRHWPTYPEIAHIPFMVSAPGLEPGTTVDTFAQPADIMPTLADLIGREFDPPEPIHGRSFAPRLRGETVESPRDFAVTGCFLRLKDGTLPTGSVTPVLYAGKWTYVPIGPNGKRELYDTVKDPYATSNIAGSEPDVARELHEKLVSWLTGLDAPSEAVSPLTTIDSGE
jgi:arylsulfatase A-like enzyme